jgi:hypothetical protein
MLTGADAAEINNKTLLLKERTYTTIRQYFSDFSEFVR